MTPAHPERVRQRFRQLVARVFARIDEEVAAGLQASQPSDDDRQRRTLTVEAAHSRWSRGRRGAR
jgi:hypothetical protein